VETGGKRVAGRVKFAVPGSVMRVRREVNEDE